MGKVIQTQAVDDLFDAILKLRNREECYRFFEDVCTVNELMSISQRFEVARMLTCKRTYLEKLLLFIFIVYMSVHFLDSFVASFFFPFS